MIKESIPALDAEVVVVDEVKVDVSCRGKIAASDDCAVKTTNRRINLRGGCIEK